MHHVLMNSEYTRKKDVRQHTGCCCAEFTNSISQNPRIRSNNHKETGSQEGKRGKNQANKKNEMASAEGLLGHKQAWQ